MACLGFWAYFNRRECQTEDTGSKITKIQAHRHQLQQDSAKTYSIDEF